MKILFWGGIKENNGPANINKGIVANLTDRFRYVTARGKCREMAGALWLLLRSDAVVISGVSRKAAILAVAARMLGKKSLYLMHGCAEAEATLNGRAPDKGGLAWESCIWKHADLLLPVSKRYMLWFREQYPQYACKTDYIYNGVDPTLFARPVSGKKQPGTVAVSGGLAPLKNNEPVIRAVEALEGKASLTVYGCTGEGPGAQYYHTVLREVLPNEEFLHCLEQTSLFVLNSRLESFSIAAVEALACGCSLLISGAAGVADILALEETDILHDPMDEGEIRRKIQWLLDHPNHDRLRSRFEPERWSFQKMVQHLEQKCEGLLRK